MFLEITLEEDSYTVLFIFTLMTDCIILRTKTHQELPNTSAAQ